MSQDFFRTFVGENLGLIQSLCRAYARDQEDLKDLVQEVTLQLWKSHKKFEGRSQVSTWVYRVTLNVCLSQSRRKNKELAKYSLDNIEVADDVDAVEMEQIELLYTAIRSLKESDRAIVLLYLENKSYKEMAEILGMTVTNIGVKVNRLKNQLKKIING